MLNKLKFDKYIYMLFLLVIIFMPKIPILNIPGTYVGIRAEDFLILIYMLFLVFSGNIFKILKSKNQLFNKVILFFGIYFFICTLSTVIGIVRETINPILGIFYLLRKLEYFLFIFVGFKFFEINNHKNNFKQIISLSVLFNAIVVILQKANLIGGFANGQYLSDLRFYRAISVFNGPYEFSAYLLLILPIFIYEIMKNKKDKILNFLFIGLIIFLIFLTQSRTSVILLIFVSFFTILLLYKEYIKSTIKKNKIKFITIFSILLLFIVSISFVFLPRLERFKTLNVNGMINTVKIAWKNKSFERYRKEGFYVVMDPNSDMSFAIRINKWMALIDGTFESPIVGLGCSITKEASDGNYIRIFAETGITGLFVWILIFAFIYKELSKNKNDEFLLTSKVGILTLFITAIFIDIFEASKIMMFFWFLLGYVCNYKKHSIEGGKNEK